MMHVYDVGDLKDRAPNGRFCGPKMYRCLLVKNSHFGHSKASGWHLRSLLRWRINREKISDCALSKLRPINALHLKFTWICWMGLDPRRINWPPSSSVLYIACRIKCTPFCGTNLVIHPTCRLFSSPNRISNLFWHFSLKIFFLVMKLCPAQTECFNLCGSTQTIMLIIIFIAYITRSLINSHNLAQTKRCTL
jgi:hypothetical protein